MPNISKSVLVDTFKGINNVLPDDKSLDGYLKELVNLDIDKNNNLFKRKGFVLQDPSSFHSLWANENKTRMFAVRNGDLVEIKADSSFTTLVPSIGDSRVTFDEVDNIVYYVSKFRAGKIENGVASTWGLQVPNNIPTLTEVPGTMSKGGYQIAVTFETQDGRESGSTLAAFIEIGDNSAIQLTNIPVSGDVDVVQTNIYATLENGDSFHRVAVLPNGTTSLLVNNTYFSDRPLETFGLYPAPNGSIVRWAHGRLYIAQDNILWWSEPYQYDHFDFKKNYYYFEEEITAVCPTPGGVWVSSDKIYYIAGKDPHSANLSEKELAKIVRGSDVKFSGSYIFIENTPLGYKWLVTTNIGIFVLFNDGVILNISEQNVSMPEAKSGASAFIQEDGINRYVSLLREKRQSNNTAIGDKVTSTIIRNGITIE